MIGRRAILEHNAPCRQSARAMRLAITLFALALTTAFFIAKTAHGELYSGRGQSLPSSSATLRWQLMNPVTGMNLRDVHMVSPTDGWAVGDGGTLLHYNGTAWSPSSSISTTDTLVDVFMLSPTNGYIVGWNNNAGGDVFHYNGITWRLEFNSTVTLNRVDATGPNDVWVSGLARIYHWNGAQWTLSYTQSSGENIFAIQMVSTTEGWATGALGLTLHYLNGTWSAYTPRPVSNTLYDLFFRLPDDGWSIGFTSTTYIVRYDGAQWTRAYTSTYPLDRIFILSPTDGWATGSVPSTITHYDGTGFTPVDNPTNQSLHGIYMLSASDGWIVGDAGTMLHYTDDGTPSATSTGTATGTATTQPTETGTASPTGTATALMTTATATASATPQACSIQFTDVPPSSTFYSYVQCLACRGIMSGYECGGTGEPCDGQNNPYFRPGNNITRGQLSKIVSNAAGYNDPPAGQSFEDVAPNSTFYPYIERMTTRGVMGGYPCGGAGEPCNPPANRPYFRPQNNATRGQISKIVSNAAGYNDPPAGQSFEDVPPSNPFYGWIERLAGRSIMGGYPCGGAGEPCNPPANRPYFRPQNNATRGQVSKIVSNAFFPNCQTR
ncbi:MAG: S-layer homology domain-containing protein [Chloroflexi bacterium]|nr:S-layer homology domain-containing protein [Chloroflexota bacterium]